MRPGLQRPPRRYRPWYERPDTRIAIVVLAILLVTGGAAIAAQGEDPVDEAPLVLAPAATETPLPTPETATPAPPVSVTATAVPAGAGAESPTERPTEEPPPATPVPPTAAVIDLRPDAVGTGETMLIWVNAPRGSGGTVLFRGASYPLTAEGDVLWAVVGVPASAGPAQETLTVTILDEAGAVVEERLVDFEVVQAERPIDYLTLDGDLISVLTAENAQRELNQRAEQFSDFDRVRRWTGFLLVPVDGITTTKFGQARSINNGPVGSHHTGEDISAPLGTPVAASAVARVSWTGEMPIRGNTIILDHGGGVLTGYHHLSTIGVEVGEFVEAGQVIGEIGSTGLSTGPHLHWELTIWGINVDPVQWTIRDFTP